MSRVYWDSMLFIYLLEGHASYAPRVLSIQEELQRRGDILCTSVFAFGEILTGVRKRGADDIASRIRDFFLKSGEVEMLPFTASTAERYSMIRAQTNVSPADAIHLASAAEAGSDLFITNDRKLRALSIPGVRFIVDMEGKLW